jgi:hypothetical protein
MFRGMLPSTKIFRQRVQWSLHLLGKAHIDRTTMPEANKSRLLPVPMKDPAIGPDSEGPQPTAPGQGVYTQP